MPRAVFGFELNLRSDANAAAEYPGDKTSRIEALEQFQILRRAAVAASKPAG